MRYPRRSGRAAWRLVDGEVVIADPAASRALVLNASASAAWMLADGLRDCATIASEVNGGGWEKETERLFEDLRLLGLVELSGTPSAGAPQAGEPPPAGNAPPAVLSSEPLEALATVCDSSYGGMGCRTEACIPLGKTPWS
jgi:hypothetical protein